MIKCEKGIVTIIGSASDAIAEWAALTAHMVAVLEREIKKTRVVTAEEGIEMVEKKFSNVHLLRLKLRMTTNLRG